MAYGDHLFVYRKGYSHHGIETEEGRVIHYESDLWQKVIGPLRKLAPPIIREVSLEEFSAGGEVKMRKYFDCDPPETVVRRARNRLGESVYNVVDNNCEHFAIWCKTGRHHSTQIHSFREALRPLGGSLATSAMLMRNARRLPTTMRPWAYGTALALSAGTFAVRYAQLRWQNFRRGES